MRLLELIGALVLVSMTVIGVIRFVDVMTTKKKLHDEKGKNE